MKNGRFSDAQVMGILKQAESGVPVSELELRLQGGRCLRFDSMMDEAALTRLIRAVEAA